MTMICGTVFEPANGVGAMKNSDWEITVRRSAGRTEEDRDTQRSSTIRHDLIITEDDTAEYFRVVAVHNAANDKVLVVDIAAESLPVCPVIALTKHRILIACQTALACYNGQTCECLWNVEKLSDLVYSVWPISRGHYLVLAETSTRRLDEQGMMLWQFSKDLVADWEIVDDATVRVIHHDSPAFDVNISTGKAVAS